MHQEIIGRGKHQRRTILARLMLSQHLQRRPHGPIEMTVIGCHDRCPDQVFDMPDHGPVLGYPAAEDNLAVDLPGAENGIDNVFSKAAAEAIADLVQLIPFLLGMNQIGLGKDGTARGYAGTVPGTRAGDLA